MVGSYLISLILAGIAFTTFKREPGVRLDSAVGY